MKTANCVFKTNNNSANHSGTVEMQCAPQNFNSFEEGEGPLTIIDSIGKGEGLCASFSYALQFTSIFLK